MHNWEVTHALAFALIIVLFLRAATLELSIHGRTCGKGPCWLA